MKVQLETITHQINRSFSMMFNPRLSDLFFWHFHPEYEVVYIEGANGTRHVGEHISTFQGSDLVLIGSNIPHLNFDYGVQTEYRKVVLHLNKEFVETHFFNVPELQTIHQLFEKSKKGVAFRGDAISTIGAKLFDLEHKATFQQYLELMEILLQLSEIGEIDLLHEFHYHNQYSNKEQERLQLIYGFVDKNYHRKIELQEVASISYLTKEAFCRYFKKMTKNTFTEFLNGYRISHSKRYLMAGKSVSEACFHSGFESLSYFNRIFKRVTGENPSAFRKQYL